MNTRARDAIKDLFPKIPDNDLFSIIKTAFQWGQSRVGTAQELTLTRRAQLSVVAHVRHTYTDYDKLLHRVGYNDARHSVEAATLDILVRWRGDGELDAPQKDDKQFDDIYNEIVVISDEEESSEEEGQILPTRRKELNVEVLDEPADRPIELRAADDTREGGIRYLPQFARQPRGIANRHPEQARQDAWNQARSRVKAGTDYRPVQQLHASGPVPIPSRQTFNFEYPQAHAGNQPIQFRPVESLHRSTYEVSSLLEQEHIRAVSRFPEEPTDSI